MAYVPNSTHCLFLNGPQAKNGSCIFINDCKKKKKEYATETVYGLKSLKDLLSGPLQKKFADLGLHKQSCHP